MRAVVVDDDYDVLEWCRIILEADGFEVECFCEPDSAYVSIIKKKPDIILSDLMMCNLDSGFEFAEKIRNHTELLKVPIIMMTAASTRHGYDFVPRDDEDLRAMKIDAFLSKPAEPNVLLSKIHELLGRIPGVI